MMGSLAGALGGTYAFRSVCRYARVLFDVASPWPDVVFGPLARLDSLSAGQAE
jgi:hypothetical protein